MTKKKKKKVLTLNTEERARRRKLQMRELMLKKLCSPGKGWKEYNYDGMKHGSHFISTIKPKKNLFSTFEPINNYESRYMALVNELSSETVHEKSIGVKSYRE